MPQVIHVAPPAYLMEATPEPECLRETNADLLDCANMRLDALRRANADKAAIRQSVGGKAQ